MQERNLRYSACILAIVAILLSMASSADIYRWVDKDGKVHLGDNPPSNTPADRIPTQAPRGAPVEDIRTSEDSLRKLKDYLKHVEEERQDKQANRQAADAVAEQKQAVRLEHCIALRKQLEQLKPLNWDGFMERGDGLDPWVFGGVAKGTREIALDPNHAAEIERLRKDVHTYCDKHKEGIAKQENAMWKDQCTAEGSRLAELKRPENRTSRTELRALEDWIEAHCKRGTRR